VNAGDYVLADSSGVAFIRPTEIGSVLSAAEMIAGREAAMAKALLDGSKVTDVMGANYEHMLR
jgi:regulator of RNase E activity RraA